MIWTGASRGRRRRPEGTDVKFWPEVLSLAQLSATVFVSVVGCFLVPPPLGAILAYLLLLCLITQWRLPLVPPLQFAIPHEKEKRDG